MISAPCSRLHAWLLLTLLAGTAAAAAEPSPGNASGDHSLPGYEIVPLGRGYYNRLDFAITIDGVKGLLFVDTGAAVTVLSEAKYAFLLKNPVPRPGNVPASTHVNHMSTAVGFAQDVRIGQVDLHNVPFPVLPQRYFYDQGLHYVQNSDRQYDGLLGENFLRPYNAVIDCRRRGLYLNTDRRRKVDLSNALMRGGWTQIPMTDARGHFTVPCTLGGQTYRLLVDTGAPLTVLDSDLVYKAQIGQRDLPLMGNIMGYAGIRQKLVAANTLPIGGYVASNVRLLSSEGLRGILSQANTSPSDPPLLGSLGGDILALNGAMIDIGNHNLYLKHPGTSAR